MMLKNWGEGGVAAARQAVNNLWDTFQVHGFRSSFRDWAGECTNFPREVVEAALAHVLKDKTEAAYARGDLFEKRRRLMTAWARFCTKPDMRARVFAPKTG